MVFGATLKFQTIANKVMKMSTLLQVNQHVHKELMPRDTHFMGQGTQQQANLQVNLRGKKKR